MEDFIIYDNQSLSQMIQIYMEYINSPNMSMEYANKMYQQIDEKLKDTPTIAGSNEEDLMQYTEYRIQHALFLYVPPLLLVIGFLGNLMSFFILRHKTMTRLTTNLFLAVLAVADTLVLFNGLFIKWLGILLGINIQQTSDWLCKSIAVLGYATAQFSVWLIVAVTVERYIVVCHALRASRICNMQRARKVVIILAITFLLINSHLFWTVGIKEELYNNKWMKECHPYKQYEVLVKKVWPWIDAVIYSISPVFVITLLNILIIKQVLIATYGRDVLRNGPLIKMEVRRCTKDNNAKLTVMLLTVSFTFLATTLPMNVVMITSLLSDSDKSEDEQLAKLWLIRTSAELLMYLNHSINFFLYCATGQKFRNIVVRIVCRRSVSNASNISDHSQHIYCSRAYGGNVCPYKNNSNEETAI